MTPIAAAWTARAAEGKWPDEVHLIIAVSSDMAPSLFESTSGVWAYRPLCLVWPGSKEGSYRRCGSPPVELDVRPQVAQGGVL